MALETPVRDQPVPSVIGYSRRRGSARQTGRNVLFFDAPIGMIFTSHAALTKHSWLDYGLFLQNLMLVRTRAAWRPSR